MAKVTKVTKVVAAFGLELSAEEAGVLRSVFRHVAGATDGLRGVVDTVDEALREVEVVPIGTATGRITFNLENDDES